MTSAGSLGESFKRPPPETLPWVEDGSIWEGADVLYAPGLTAADDIVRSVSGAGGPLNVLALPDTPQSTSPLLDPNRQS